MIGEGAECRIRAQSSASRCSFPTPAHPASGGASAERRAFMESLRVFVVSCSLSANFLSYVDRSEGLRSTGVEKEGFGSRTAGARAGV